jgi:hypothetical protein
MKNLDETLQWLLDAIAIWLQCIAKPVATLNNILVEETDAKHLSTAAKVWVPSLLISLIISFPVLKLYGIEWNNVGFHLCTWTTTVISLVVTAFIVHHVLLGLKLKSEFMRTLIIYTVIVTTYAPVSNFLALPSTLRSFAAVQNFKQHPIALDAAAIAFFQSAAHPTSNFEGTIDNVFGALILIFSVGIVALFAESLSQWYGNNRFKCYSAIAASTCLSGVVLLLVLTPMQLFVMYAFVGISPS